VTITTGHVQLVDLKRQYASLKSEILEAVEAVLEDMNLFLGKNVTALEQEFAAFCGVKEAVGVGSGTEALYLALKAAGIGPGDEVITVSHTFIATANAVAATGATPVFVDIDPRTMTMDGSLVEAAVTSRTRALLPVHLYGRLADMDTLAAIAREYDLFLLEDACQAHGAEREGRRAGSFGGAGAFSFYYSKNLGAYGEAGMVTTDDAELAERVRLLRNHGSRVRYEHLVTGSNSRLDELQAAVLRVKLRRLEEWNRRRRELAAAYNRQLAGIEGLELPPLPEDGEHVFHLYAVRTPLRDSLQRALEAGGVSTGIHYPVPVHLQAAYAGLGYAPGLLPHTEAAAREVLSLPLFPELELEEVERVCAAVRDYFA
jgi:dTDP-4-amino-4,6-dideoxygalactose transaminase